MSIFLRGSARNAEPPGLGSILVGAFEETSRLQPQKIWEGVAGRVVHGDRLTLGLVELEPGSHVPEHSHENEQLGMLISGSCQFRVGDETRELGPGDTWSIPANTRDSTIVGCTKIASYSSSNHHLLTSSR